GIKKVIVEHTRKKVSLNNSSPHTRSNEPNQMKKNPEGNEIFQIMADQSLMGIIVIQEDLVKYINQVCADIVEVPIKELPRWTLKDLEQLVHPEDQWFFRKRQRIREGSEQGEVDPQFLIRIVTKSGQTKWIEIFSKTIILDQKPALFITALDITERKQAEEIVRENEEKYRLFLNILPFPILVLKKDMTILYCNNIYAEFVGKPLIDLEGENLLKLFPAFEKTQSHATFLEVLDAGKPKEVEEWINGNYLHYWIYPTPSGIITIFENITVRKQAEDARLKSEEKYRIILESIEDGYFETDIAGNLTFFNDSLCTLLGYPRDELSHMNNRDFMDEETAKYAYGLFNEVYQTGVPKKITNWEIVRKDGTKRSIEASASLIVSPSGEKVGFRGIARDITERKQAEEARKESEEKYQELVEKIGEGIGIVDPDETFTHVNPAMAEIFGVPQEQLVGRNLREFMTPEEFQMMRERTEERRTGARGNYETTIIRPDGERRHVSIHAAPQLDKDGNFIGAFGFLQDITERKKAEKRLIQTKTTVEELNESLRVINSILRHDILHDLTIIRGHLELYQLERDETDLDQAYKVTDKSVDLITRMRELEYLAFRDKPLKMHNVRQIIETVLKNYKDTTTEFYVQGEGIILADQALNSVIDNIIRNAMIHATTERIDIVIAEKIDFCEVRIADYGVGIPDKIKSQIFDPGFKYGEAGHMGLGLYIVKKVVERYGGEVWVEDNAPTGTVFVLRLRKADKTSDS
ncbi:MAG: PAS domain S-box protein, partial [Candidatus Hodarchaeota archaeon]